jgi:hypothetical protein
MRVEHVDRRVLGAVRFVDAATGTEIEGPLAVSAPGVSWIRNLEGWYVIASAPGLDAYVAAFEAPTAPHDEGLEHEAPLDLWVTVRDPRGRYLPRRRKVELPRDPDPNNAASPDSLFRVIDVQVFASPAAPSPRSWATVRASVTRTGSGAPVGGALVRVVRVSDGQRLASGLTDARGEALVPVPGIPLTTWDAGPGPVLATEVEVRLEIVVDPSAPEIPDPDDLETKSVELRVDSSTAMLASGGVYVAPFTVTLP